MATEDTKACAVTPLLPFELHFQRKGSIQSLFQVDGIPVPGVKD